MRLPDDAIERLLVSWPVARLAVAGPGAPLVVPIVFARIGRALVSPVDGKPKTTAHLARLARIRTAGVASVLLDHYEADWSRLWWLRIEGAARVCEASGPDDPALAEASAALRAKHPQYATTSLFADAPVWLRIEIERVTSWAAGPRAIEAAGGRAAREGGGT